MSAFNEAMHPRVSAGSAGGGQWTAGGSNARPAAKTTAPKKTGGTKPAAKTTAARPKTKTKTKKTVTAKGGAPMPGKPGKSGGRYTKTQFGQLQSLERQHQRGAKLTAKQAHALHVAHELHLQHERAAGARQPGVKRAPKLAAKKTGKAKTAKTGARKTTAVRTARTTAPARSTRPVRAARTAARRTGK